MKVLKILGISLIISLSIFSCRQSDQDGEMVSNTRMSVSGRSTNEDSLGVHIENDTITIQSLEEQDTDPHIPPKK